MKVERIELRGVTVHDHRVVDLPPRGIVLIIGPNGAGKSSIIESVPLAVWGKTIRGAPVWSSNTGVVGVYADGWHVVRRATGAARVRVEGKEAFESTKHAQAWLDSVFGPFAQWRRMCVLTAADEDTFTRATDAGRKKIVEQAIGADNLESAYRKAREVAKAKAYDLSLARNLVSRYKGRVEEARAACDAAEKTLGSVPPRPPRPEPFERKAETLAEQVAAVRSELSDVRAELASVTAVLRERERVARVIEQGVCPTCGRPLDADDEHPDGPVQGGDTADLEARADALRADVERLRAELTDLTTRHAQVQAEAADARAAWREWIALSRARKEAEEAAQGARERLAQAEAKHREAVEAVVRAEDETRVAERAAATLAPTGVRAHLLAEALAYLELEANRWLDVLGDRLRVRIRPTKTKADGTTADAVSLTVEGAGGADGRYQAASGGERRRVDLAVSLAVLALGETFAGRSGSTVFVDEAFESLDAEGREAAATAVRALAEDRCVVVVTHTATKELRAVADRVVELG